MIKKANSGHTGGSLSCVDILNVLYNCILNVDPANPLDPDRDRYIQSKGHSVEALYTVLADRGFFPAEWLDTFAVRATLHRPPDPQGARHRAEHRRAGPRAAVAVGMALAAKMDGRSFRVFTLLGDGELTEGSNWEASMSRRPLPPGQPDRDRRPQRPADHRADRKGDGARAAGRQVPRLWLCRAHGARQRLRRRCSTAFNQLPFEPGKPNLVLAQTVKGKGVSFIENTADWHHHVPDRRRVRPGAARAGAETGSELATRCAEIRNATDNRLTW